MTYTALLHCTYANYQLDYVRDSGEKNIEDFLRDSKSYKAVWAKLFDSETGKCVRSYRRKEEKKKEEGLTFKSPQTPEEFNKFAEIMAKPISKPGFFKCLYTPTAMIDSRMLVADEPNRNNVVFPKEEQVDVVAYYDSLAKKFDKEMKVPEGLLTVEKTPSGKCYAHSGLTDHEIEYFTREPVLKYPKETQDNACSIKRKITCQEALDTIERQEQPTEVMSEVINLFQVKYGRLPIMTIDDKETIKMEPFTSGG